MSHDHAAQANTIMALATLHDRIKHIRLLVSTYHGRKIIAAHKELQAIETQYYQLRSDIRSTAAANLDFILCGMFSRAIKRAELTVNEGYTRRILVGCK